MEDDELAAIRAARIQQLKQQAGSPNPAGGRSTPSGDNDDGAQRAAEDEMRRNLLATVLDASARERRTHKLFVAPIYIADAPYVSW
jgi:DNA-binding TFAR19-related protein (PDSD5 family)